MRQDIYQKKIKTAGLVLPIAFLITGSYSCKSSSSMEADAKEIAHCQCDMVKMINRYGHPLQPGSSEDSLYKKLEDKLHKLTSDFKTKYGDINKDHGLRDKVEKVITGIMSECPIKNN